MCGHCYSGQITRRGILQIGGAGFAGLALGAAPLQTVAADGPSTGLTPDEALSVLKTGNGRYVDNPELCSLDLARQRESTAKHQAPWASIVSCADSRVPPELIFGGHGIGELFVARNAGNLIYTATLGTLVLAHTSCGAVKAACEVVTDNATYPGAISRMIEPIIPAAIAARDQAGDFVENTARESARRTAVRLAGTGPLLANFVAAGKVKIAAAIYDLKSGIVSYVD